MIKKMILASIFMLLTFVLVGQTAIAPSAGNGSSASPYQISSLENLYWITAANAEVPEPNQSVRWSSHYIQTTDIDASDSAPWFWGGGWLPIGSSTVPFTGKYDGGGHVVDGLYGSSSSTYRGMFGNISYAEISNLGLTNIYIRGSNYTGAIAGATSNSLIKNCFVAGDITGSSGTSQFIGGLVGLLNTNSQILNCYNRADVNLGRSKGGLVGSVQNTSSLVNSYSTGSVSYNATSTGGLVGHTAAGGSATNSYWNISTSGYVTSVLGEGRTTEQMVFPYNTEETYYLWDFETIWVADENYTFNEGYPFLYWQVVIPYVDSIIISTAGELPDTIFIPAEGTIDISFRAEVFDNNNDTMPEERVSWIVNDIVGANCQNDFVTIVTINELNGILTVSSNATVGEIEIKAISDTDTDVFYTLTINLEELIIIDPPVVTISETEGTITITWDTVDGANVYKVFANSNISELFPDNWLMLTTTENNYYQEASGDYSRFYRVVAAVEE